MGRLVTLHLGCEALVHGAPRGALLLHGYSFRYTVWSEPSITGFLEERGLGYAAPDMPYGRSTSCQRRTRSVEENLRVARAAVEAAGLQRFVAVGASMGARYALALAAVDDRVAGLLLLGPAVKPEEAQPLPRRVPVLVARGSRDRLVPRTAAEELAGLLGGEYVEIEGAGHVLHRDNPVEAKKLLERVLEAAGLDGD